MFGFLKKIFSDNVKSVDIELPFHHVPLASYPVIIPKEILNQIKNGEKIMNNSETIEINGGDLFQWTDSNLNIGHLKENYLKLPADCSILLDLKSGSYWTSKTLGHELIEQIKTWLLRGQLRKVPEGNSVSITQKTIKNEDEDPMELVQTLIESLEELGQKITESYNDHSLAIKQCEADLRYIKDISDS